MLLPNVLYTDGQEWALYHSGELVGRVARGMVPNRTMTSLARDWRELLFPRLDDKDFADAYAQTVTFALLLARHEGIDFSDVDVHRIARQLGKKHLLLGKALDTQGVRQSRGLLGLELAGAVERNDHDRIAAACWG